MPACWLACVWSLGSLCEDGRSVDSSSELTLISSSIFSFGYTTSCSRHCVSLEESQERGLLREISATLEPHAAGLPVPGHLGNAIGQPMTGLDSTGLGGGRIEGFSRPTSWCSGTWGSHSVARRLRGDVGCTNFFRN